MWELVRYIPCIYHCIIDWYLLPANLHDALVAMYEHACEASALLSGFKHVSQDRTALTSECGSLLEEVHKQISSSWNFLF